MNEKSDQKNDKVIDENVFVPNISSDNNANQNGSNNVKATGAIPKTKNVANGITELKIKVNNNKITEPNLLKPCVESQTNGCTYSNGDRAESPKMEHLYMNGKNSGPSSSCNEENQLHVESDEYSSDTGNDELSCCDDCCIYTYKGDVADLPRSFMNLEQDNGEGGSRAGSRGSSPEMDFLEMDFDPGPSCDAESDESSANIDLKDCDDKENSDNFNRDEIKNSEYQKKDFAETNVDLRPSTSKLVSNNLESNNYDFEPKPGCSKSDYGEPKQSSSLESNYNLEPQLSFPKSDEFLKRINSEEPQPCSSKSEENPQNNLSQFKLLKEQNVNTPKEQQNEDNMNEPWIPKDPSQRTVACPIVHDCKGHHSSGGDLILWNENTLPINSSESRLNTSSSLYHSTMEKKLVLDKQPSNVESFIEKTMIWTEQEAALKQVTQISTSACGATAVINVLKVLGYEIPPNEKVLEHVVTRPRANNSPLLRYLQSRSVAGSMHSDIIEGLEALSGGRVYARFFHMHPERYMNLSLWLSYWISKGAVPVATLNLQRGIGPGGVPPDSWHHQMVFGVGPHGVYLTNPLERVEESLLWHQLSSDSELLVRREDVISRFDFASLKEMMALKDYTWKRFNVVGQTANVVREHRLKAKILSRSHVRIPASYRAGITLAMDSANPSCVLLRTCPELPIARPQPPPLPSPNSASSVTH